MAHPADLTFELELGEYVTAGGGVALVRIAGRWRANQLMPVEAPRLCAAAGSETAVVQPLPDPTAPEPAASLAGEPWRAAFSLPLALVTDEHAAFWLEGGGARVSLPRPLEHGEERATAASAGRPAPTVVRRRRRLGALMRLRVQDQGGDLESALAHERKLRQAVERDLRDQLEEKQSMRVDLRRLMIELEHQEDEAPLMIADGLRRQVEDGLAQLDAIERQVEDVREAARAAPAARLQAPRLREGTGRRLAELDALERRLTAVREALDGETG